MKLSILVAGCAIAGALSTACAQSAPAASPDKGIQIAESAEVNYYFEMDETRARALLQEVDALRSGVTRAEAIAQLGPPDFDQDLMTKEGKPLGHAVSYYLKIYKKGVSNVKHDQYVQLRFDTNDRLTEILRKIPGVEPHSR